MSMSDSDSEEDQLQYLRDGSVKPGMFVSGWEDPNDTIDEDKNPTETLEREILWAVNEGKIDLVREILKTDASCVHAVDQDGYTPLHRACYNNNVEMAKLLLKYGANTNAVTEYRWTPLHSACKWGNTECVALLLQFGSNINATSDGDQTPLHITATVSNCRPTAATLLFNNAIKPDLLNNSGERAEEIARRTGMTTPVFKMGHSPFQVQTGLI